MQKLCLLRRTFFYLIDLLPLYIPLIQIMSTDNPIVKKPNLCDPSNMRELSNNPFLPQFKVIYADNFEP